jgi:hypothetical protein
MGDILVQVSSATQQPIVYPINQPVQDGGMRLVCEFVAQPFKSFAVSLCRHHTVAYHAAHRLLTLRTLLIKNTLVNPCVHRLANSRRLRA